MDKKLYRDETHKVVGGVCAGLAEYFGIDVTIIRLVFLVTLILKGGGGLLYIVLWIVLPKKPYAFQQPPVTDYTVPPVTPQTDPAFYPHPKKRSSGTVIAGTILVLLGMFFILDDLHIIPNWDMEHLWPVILIAVGVVVLFSGKKQPWENSNWHQNDESAKKDEPQNDNSTNDNSTTI